MKLRLALVALSAVLLAGAAAPAYAQAGAGSGSRPRDGAGSPMMGNQQRANEMLFQGITLTADQKDKVKAVDETFKPRMDALRTEMRGAMQSGSPNPELRTKMTALTAEQRTALRAILDEGQQKTFDQNVAKMAQRGGGRGGRGGPPPTSI